MTKTTVNALINKYISMSKGIKIAGAVTNEISVRIEFQPDDSEFCGPACVQMVLSWFGIRYLRQKDLFAEIQEFQTVDPDTEWSSTPDGIENILNEHKPKDFPGEFKLFARKDQIGIARRMVWVLFQFKVPCIALVEGTSHWVVVYGYEPQNAQPVNPDDTDYDIDGFYIRDPYHGETQGYIEYKSWINDYADDLTTGYWKDRFMAICDPAPKKQNIHKGKTDKKKSPEQQIPAWLKIPVNPNPDPESEKPYAVNTEMKSLKDFPVPSTIKIINPVNKKLKIIDPVTAGKYAQWVLHTGKFYNGKMLKMIMTKPSPGDSVLVKKLDADDYYYLVPMKDLNQKIYALMIIAAREASHRESMFSMYMKKHIQFQPLTEEKIRELLIKRKLIKQEEVEKIRIFGALVWKLCTQSLSPFLPFHQVKIGSVTLFIRIDGAVFEKLTKNARGL